MWNCGKYFSGSRPGTVNRTGIGGEAWLTGKYSHVFNLVLQRFHYLRQFAPTLLESLTFQAEEANPSLIQAAQLLKENEPDGKRKLPEDTPCLYPQ